jgi:SWI/SNF-related matrix-associated actin-dependent regulator of chromatin subfamily A-like protein 1
MSNLAAAVRALSSVCDGAASEDQVGYNGSDAPFGNRLALLPDDEWTPGMRREAWEMLGKYRQQLARYGIAYDAIEAPAAVAGSDARAEARERARERAARTQRRVRLGAADGASRVFVLTFPYDPELVAQVKQLPGRRFDGATKAWNVPASPGYSVHALHTFLTRHGFHGDELVDAAVERMLREEPATAEPELPPAGSITLNGDGFVVRFEFNPELVAHVKRVAGARWDPAGKAWRVPAEPSSAEELLAFGRAAGIDADEQAAAALHRLAVEMKERLVASSASSAELHVEGLGGTLRPFQAAGVLYLSRVRRGFCADDMGLGKTVQAAAAIQHNGAYPAVVVCPASLKLNWRRELLTWLPGRSILVASSKTTPLELAAADVIVVNYDLLKIEMEDKKNPRSKYTAVGLLADIIAVNPVAVVLDESHACKNGKAQRTRACKLLVERKLSSSEKSAGGGAPYRWLLSGTPLLNRPVELVSQLQILGRLGDLGGYTTFTRRYCGAHTDKWGRRQASGASNLTELNEKLRATCFVRRVKSEVLKELPPKVRATVPVEIANRADYDQAERDLIAWLISSIEDEETRDAKVMAALRAEQLVKMNALALLAARGKLPAIREWVREFLESGEKLVLFGHHREIVDTLAAEFRAPSITGDTPIIQRQAHVDRFQSDPDTRLIVLNLQAGGVGLTLTAASNVAFAEYGWHAAIMDQAEDRTHRIGQLDSVTSWWLVGENTIDEIRCDLIESKRADAAAAMDGEIVARQQSSMVADVARRLRAKGG